MHDKDGLWHSAFTSMFSALDVQDCTPDAILETMRWMPRASNRLADITIAARTRNIAANDDEVLACLRILYKQGKIAFRDIAGRHFFSYIHPNP